MAVMLSETFRAGLPLVGDASTRAGLEAGGAFLEFPQSDIPRDIDTDIATDIKPRDVGKGDRKGVGKGNAPQSGLGRITAIGSRERDNDQAR
jgi:hypothetical protein